jgi:eukaryotic-like serine/threonine-protein kinase
VIGETVGRYRITAAYPHSGWRALDITDCTRVHLDVADPDCDDWRDRAIQHLRATSIVASLTHPGVAQIHGRGVLRVHRPYVASSLAEGVPLAEIIARRTITIDEASMLLRDLAEVAAHAHAHGILHGSIRPHLVVLRTGDKPFSIQLGGWADLCAPGPIVDMPPELTAYMAPELVHGVGQIDGAIDVYAIAAIVYRSLTNKFPGMLPPEQVDNVPPALSSLIVRMLATDAAERPTAQDVLHLGLGRRSRPRWTPAPLPDSEGVADILDLAAARSERN